MQNNMTLSVTQPNAAVFRYSTRASTADTNGSQKLSLTETSVQNLLTARAKSLLHTSKHKKVELPRCYCNNEWHEYCPKNTKRQNIWWKLNFTVTNQKWPKNGQISQNGQMRFFMACAVKKWPNFSKLAMKWPVWHPCLSAHPGAQGKCSHRKSALKPKGSLGDVGTGVVGYCRGPY